MIFYKNLHVAIGCPCWPERTSWFGSWWSTLWLHSILWKQEGNGWFQVEYDEQFSSIQYFETDCWSDRLWLSISRFWKQGYWRSHLQGRRYHISALYVVDLKRFRRIAAGDRLRGQYQALSQDPNSLSNLDQVCISSLNQFYFKHGVLTNIITYINNHMIHKWWSSSQSVLKFLSEEDYYYYLSHYLPVSRIFPTTWFIRYPSSLFHKSGYGVKHGVMTSQSNMPKQLTW